VNHTQQPTRGQCPHRASRTPPRHCRAPRVHPPLDSSDIALRGAAIHPSILTSPGHLRHAITRITTTTPHGVTNTRHLRPCTHEMCYRYCDDYTGSTHCDLCANIEGTEDWTTTECPECYNITDIKASDQDTRKNTTHDDSIETMHTTSPEHEASKEHILTERHQCLPQVEARGHHESLEGTSTTKDAETRSHAFMGTLQSRMPSTQHTTEPEPNTNGYIRSKCWNEGCTNTLLDDVEIFCEECEDQMEPMKVSQLDTTTNHTSPTQGPHKRLRSRDTRGTVESNQPHLDLPPCTSRRSRTLLPNNPAVKWYAPCSTPLCPCTASFNGQDNEACGRRCRSHGPCTHNYHTYPRQAPREGDKRQPVTTKHVARMTRDEHKKQRQTPTYYRSSHTGKGAHPRG